MGLVLQVTKTKAESRAVFRYDQGDMDAAWTLSTLDGGADLVRKLERMLAFLRRETAPSALQLAGMVMPAQEGPPPAARPQAPRAEPLSASLAKAQAQGWELYTGDEED